MPSGKDEVFEDLLELAHRLVKECGLALEDALWISGVAIRESFLQLYGEEPDWSIEPGEEPNPNETQQLKEEGP